MSGAEDVPPVAGGDLTDLLRACLVALRLPPHAGAYQPRRLPFWGVGDATGRITQRLKDLPEGAGLDVFLPKVAEAGSDRALHCRAAVAATFLAGLELARGGALAMDQHAPWQPVHVQPCGGGSGSPDSPAKPMGAGEKQSRDNPANRSMDKTRALAQADGAA